MIECKNISIELSGKTILSDLSLKCPNGSITVILGKNGCGKTTLLKAISGLYRYSGSILADSTEVCTTKNIELARKISLMPQLLTHPNIQVKRLVAFGRSPYTGISGILSPADIRAVNSAIEITDICAIRDSFVNRISGGEQRKAFFAMLIAQGTKNILLDEPCANMDVKYSAKILRLIRSLKEQNKTVIAVFHDVNTALEIADKVVFIEHGKCIFEGTPYQAITEKLPEKVFELKPYKFTDENGNKCVFYKQ